MKEKFVIEIKAALSLILSENISALREIIKRLSNCFTKPASRFENMNKRVCSPGSKKYKPS
jgi:hypothetical protein